TFTHQSEGERGPQKVTPESTWRYACFFVDVARDRLVAVGEEHLPHPAPPRNALVAIDACTGRLETLHEGEDFYSSPCLSLDGRQLAWISWNHPHMPWDQTALWVAEVDPAGALKAPKKILECPGRSVL